VPESDGHAWQLPSGLERLPSRSLIPSIHFVWSIEKTSTHLRGCSAHARRKPCFLELPKPIGVALQDSAERQCRAQEHVDLLPVESRSSFASSELYHTGQVFQKVQSGGNGSKVHRRNARSSLQCEPKEPVLLLKEGRPYPTGWSLEEHERKSPPRTLPPAAPKEVGLAFASPTALSSLPWENAYPTALAEAPTRTSRRSRETASRQEMLQTRISPPLLASWGCL
jgi:TfoX/Sxy family transcriptional regulator of competence genes